jgi:hypothetical protein
MEIKVRRLEKHASDSIENFTITLGVQNHAVLGSTGIFGGTEWSF